jgi:hypothetical protein
MKNPFRLINLTAALVLALVFGALLPGVAFADGETPPAPDATEVSGEGTTAEATPTETSPTEAAPTEVAMPTVGATETPASVQEIITEPVPVEGELTEPLLTDSEVATTADLLAELPEGTDLVVLNAEGDPVPLASEEATEILAGGDPIWCPSGVVTPTPSLNGCTASQTTFAALLALISNKTVDGVIWIEKTYSSGELVTIDGSSLGTTANYKLTLKGGWNGLGTNTIDTSTPSNFSGPLQIINWNNNVTLSDILLSYPLGPLNITTTKNIVLNRVQVLNSLALSAASLNNTISLGTGPGTGSVTVTNSTFTGNFMGGLGITSNGSVTLGNVTSNNNWGTGVQITNSGGIGAVIVNNSTFNNNSGFGLSIVSRGTITLNGVTANNNATGGALLNNSAGIGNVTISNSSFNSNTTSGDGLQIISGAGTVTVINSSFNDNWGNGLQITSNNTVTLKNVFAYANGLDDGYSPYVNFSGVTIDNTSASTAKAVTISNSVFSGNGLNGLQVLSKGTITLNYITADGNGSKGADLQNWSVTTAAPIYVNGVNAFNQNYTGGLYAKSNGLINVSKTTASGNGVGAGVELTNQSSPFSVGISITGYLNADNNGDYGLKIYSTGAVTAANLTTNKNWNGGSYIENTFWCPASVCYAKNVTITGYNAFNDNLYEDGLQIKSRGAVTLYNLTASGNGFSSAHSGVEINNAYTAALQMPVTLTGANVFLNNLLHGLDIKSYGAVSLSNITANNNGYSINVCCVVYSETMYTYSYYYGSGAQIDNRGGIYAKPVSITGTNMFDYNLSGFGLRVDSDGAITVSKVTASNNRYGAYLKNDGPVQANVTISGYGMFTANGYFGLTINSHGAITLTKIMANSNTGNGAVLSTIGLTGTHAVTLYGVNTFNSNGGSFTSGSGLIVNADGNITVNNISANFNSAYGALLDNYTNWFTNPYSATLTPEIPFSGFGSVKVNGYGTFIRNSQFCFFCYEDFDGGGLLVSTHGSVTLNRVVADRNGSSSSEAGIKIIADGNITLVCSSAYHNYGLGLDASTPGTLTLKGFMAYMNGLDDEDLSYGFLVRSTCP